MASEPTGPWWESDEECNGLVDALAGVWSWGVWEHVVIRTAARRAVETHGHVAGCECFVGGYPDKTSCRDPRCMEGAKP